MRQSTACGVIRDPDMTSTQTKLTFAKRIIGALTTMVVVACGGGGGGAGSGGGFLPDNNGTPTPSYTLTISGKNAGGVATNEFSASSPLTIEVLVEDTSTNTATVVSGAVVDLQSTVGAITPANASALTNASGVAEFTLSFNDEEGAGTVTASYVLDDTTYSDTFNVQSIVEPTTEPVITLSLAATNSTGDTVTTLSQRSPATLTASFVSTLDGVATPISGELVTISTNIGDVSPSNNTALTDADGDAVFTVSFNGTEGAGPISIAASLGGVDYTDTLNLQVMATDMNYQLTLYQSDGSTPLNGSSLTVENPLSFVARLEDVSTGAAVPVESELVLASATIGSLNQASALTDALGEASFTLSAAGIVGAGVVSVNFETPLGVVTAQANVSVMSNASVGYAIEIVNGSNGWVFSDANPLTLDVRVAATDASDLSGLLVTLTTDLGVVVGNGSGVLENITGSYTANFTVNYANVVGAGTLTASFSAGGETFVDAQSVETVSEEAYMLSITQDVTTVTQRNPMTLTVRLNDAGGSGQANKTVTLSSTIGALNRTSGVTDAAGETNFVLSYDGSSGDGLVTASYTLNGNTYTQSLRVVIAGLPFRLSGITFSDFNGDPIADAIVSSTDLYREITSSVTLTDLGGNALENRLIQFVSTKGQLTPIDGYVLTDATGVADVIIAYTDDIISGIGELSASYVSALGTVSVVADVQAIAPNLLVGTIDGINFTEADLASTPASGSLVNQGSALLQLDIVNSNLDITNASDTDRIKSAQTVAFSSFCLDNGLSTLSPASPITTSSGQLSATYTAGAGCTGDDEVIATLQFGGSATAQTASQVLTIAAAVEALSIEFVDVTPTTLAIAGTGALSNVSEAAVAQFRVVDGNGSPVQGETVNFSLSSTVGGLSLSIVSALSGADGLLSVTLNSGNVPTSTVITAELDSTGQLVSSALVTVSTAIPDQNSFTIFSDNLSVSQAYPAVNQTSNIFVRLADRYNNVVPDGSVVYFTTEYGAIDASCSIVAGECSVVWRSQAPKPIGSNLSTVDCPDYDNDGDGIASNDAVGIFDPCPTSSLTGIEQGSRTTILATTTGEESFLDVDGDGLMSDFLNEFIGLQHDLGEPYLDANEDGAYQINEFFVDDDSSGLREDGDNFYTGIGCTAATLTSGECTGTILSVFDNIALIFSSSDNLYIALVDVGATPDSSVLVEPGVDTVAAGSYVAYFSDQYNNQPANGATITVSASGDCSIVSPTTFTVPNNNAANAYEIGIEIASVAATAGADTVSVSIANPGAATVTQTFTCIP